MLKVILFLSLLNFNELELNFKDKPNYEYIRGLFREIAIKNKIMFDL